MTDALRKVYPRTSTKSCGIKNMSYISEGKGGKRVSCRRLERHVAYTEKCHRAGNGAKEHPNHRLVAKDVDCIGDSYKSVP